MLCRFYIITYCSFATVAKRRYKKTPEVVPVNNRRRFSIWRKAKTIIILRCRIALSNTIYLLSSFRSRWVNTCFLCDIVIIIIIILRYLKTQKNFSSVNIIYNIPYSWYIYYLYVLTTLVDLATYIIGFRRSPVWDFIIFWIMLFNLCCICLSFILNTLFQSVFSFCALSCFRVCISIHHTTIIIYGSYIINNNILIITQNAHTYLL